MCCLNRVLASQAWLYSLVSSFRSLLPESLKVWYAAWQSASSRNSRSCSVQFIYIHLMASGRRNRGDWGKGNVHAVPPPSLST
jgi:hypothetical protein